MALSDELVSEVTKKLVGEEIEKAQLKLVPIIKKQIEQYMASAAFLKKIKEQVMIDLDSELEDGDRLFEWFSDSFRRKLMQKAISSILK